MARIADLKNNLSRYLNAVRRGGEIVVYDRNAPIARIVPFAPSREAAARGRRKAAEPDERLAELVRQGVLTAGDSAGVAAWLDAHPPVELPVPSPGAVEMLLAARRESTR